MTDLVDRIEEVRTRNNTHWMALLRLALEAEPERAKEILRNIQECDTMITKLLKEIAES